jgi:hypothetical protein
MHESYADITSRIPGDPLWWDEHAVPRYEPFSHELAANIYADEVALCEIACCDCSRKFSVAFSRSEAFELIEAAEEKREPHPTLYDSLSRGNWHYGDPPNYGCCPAGPTMNSEPIRVLEYWHRVKFDWVQRTVKEERDGT